MKKILFLFLVILISSCQKQELIFAQKIEKNEKVFAIIPHHNLVNKDIDSYYQNLKNTYTNFNNIVIISPNHFGLEARSFPKDGKYCFLNQLNSCVNGKAISSFWEKKMIASFEEKENYTNIKEHGIGNHFQFIQKYFQKSSVYGIILKIETKETENLKLLEKILQSYDFKGKTLFVASVDFSHHTNEKIAVFHDLKTLNYLNGTGSSELEVDCPNCLYLEKNLAQKNGDNFFNIFKRTSNDKNLGINSNYENTSHIYWEFSPQKNDSQATVFSGSYLSSQFEKNSKTPWNKNQIFWMFFWDMHFTRWFDDKKNLLEIEDHLQCFYSNKDKNKKPEFWHNRLLYSFDFVGANLETSVWEKAECNKSDKSILFRTEPKYLDYFKKIWINLYNISNNHSYDCWQSGFDATKKHLSERGLYYYWDGRKTEENILKKEVNNTKIAFVWFNNIDFFWEDTDKVKKIEKLHNEDYIVIVNIHWWQEYITHSNKRQQDLARKFIDAGANLIIWHHPHVTQEYEIYKWVPIFYSLWNFIFDQPFEETLPWYGIVFAINWSGIQYNIVEFRRNKKNYAIVCQSFH